MPRILAPKQRGDLPLPRHVGGLAQHAGGLLGRVEAHGVFGGDEVEAPLCLALAL